MKTATAARIPQRGSAPSAPVRCRTERARARPSRPNPSACAPTITTTLAPAQEGLHRERDDHEEDGRKG
eukprot:3245223-Prymnesium_polylepis.1